MSSLHPHWQSTDEGSEREVPITIRSKNQAPQNTQMFVPRAKRRPAAFVGIFLFMVMGFAAFQGYITFSRLTGDVAAPVSVIIKTTGVDPINVNVKAGETIEWKNLDTIPHILASDTLPTENGKPFTTAPIFPNATAKVTIPSTAAEGTYSYISHTSKKVNGTIVIAGSVFGSTGTPNTSTSTRSFASESAIIPPAPAMGTADTTNSAASGKSQSKTLTSITPASSSSSVQTFSQATVQETFTQPASTTLQPLIPSGTSGLPENPHTVGTAPSGIQDFQNYDTSPLLANVSKRPTQEASTGPEVWIVITLSIGALLIVIRKQLFS